MMRTSAYKREARLLLIDDAGVSLVHRISAQAGAGLLRS